VDPQRQQDLSRRLGSPGVQAYGGDPQQDQQADEGEQAALGGRLDEHVVGVLPGALAGDVPRVVQVGGQLTPSDAPRVVAGDLQGARPQPLALDR
jgi:hypothetical protein